jgi:hypothetical protein
MIPTTPITRLKKNFEQEKIANAELRIKVQQLERELEKERDRRLAQTNGRIASYWQGWEHGKFDRQTNPPKEEK